MPHDYSDIKMGKLIGEVRGYKGEDVTRGLSPANVFVKIWLQKGKKPKVYSPFEKKDMEKLKEEFPSIYTILLEYSVFKDHPVDKFGKFHLDVPIGNWGYIVSAYVEKNEGQHIDSLGDDGKGKGTHEVIIPSDFNDEKRMTLEGIVVPVEDRLWEPPKGTKKGDPKTDPGKVKPGEVPDDVFRKIEDRRKRSSSGE